MTTLELNDIQGIIPWGYGDMKHAYFVLLKITNPNDAKKWLGDLAGDRAITHAGDDYPNDIRLNIAFTQAGFEKLGLKKAQFYEDKRFSIEFEDGMITEHRQNILGDSEGSDPEEWYWGGPKTTPVHVLLLLYAHDKDRDDQEALKAVYASHRTKFESNGLAEVLRLDTVRLPKRKEHFGFRDGIAQPEIAGMKGTARSQKIFDKGGSDGNIVAAGEFILGYRNAYSKMPAGPKVEPAGDVGNNLQDDGKGARDFGRNGSYLVFRQLRQNVREFWEYIDKQTQNPNGSSNPQARDGLAAKMVGRWRSGVPLAKSPDKDLGEDDPRLDEWKDADDFLYYDEDFHGDICPVASHIRRSNPRDVLDQDKKVSASIVNKHRMIRRGRAYGKLNAKSMDPEDLLAADPDKEVGLQFICFNANIGRQFEFIQHTWVNSPKFHGLYSEADPLLGTDQVMYKKESRRIFGKFAAPGVPLRQRVSDLKRYVDVVGGAYFFMPGINAIKYLANLPEQEDLHQ